MRQEAVAKEPGKGKGAHEEERENSFKRQSETAN